MKSAIFPTLLLLLSAIAAQGQETVAKSDCGSLKFSRHKTPCLCGRVVISSGDVGLAPASVGLDDSLDVELRDRAGIRLESKRLSYKSERTFCFSGKPKGKYELAFVLYKEGIAQPAMVYPTKYTAKGNQACDAVYPVQVVCPK